MTPLITANLKFEYSIDWGRFYNDWL
jgi:hypothetical protein